MSSPSLEDALKSIFKPRHFCARTTGNVEINIVMKNLMFQNLFQNQNVQSQSLITRRIGTISILNIQISNSEESNIGRVQCQAELNAWLYIACKGAVAEI